MAKITYASVDDDWARALKTAAEKLQAAWADSPVKRMHLAPIGGLKYYVAVGFSEAAEGPLGQTEIFVLGGEVVSRWTPATRVAALKQIGLPAARPAPEAVARFLDATGLFTRADFPGVWLDGALRAGVQVRGSSAPGAYTLIIDYPVVPDPAGGGAGATAAQVHRLTVGFDGAALTVEHAIARR